MTGVDGQLLTSSRSIRLIYRCQPCGHHRRRTQLPHTRSSALCRGHVPPAAPDRLGERRDVAGIDESLLLDQLRQRTDAACHDRHACGHRLSRRHPKRLGRAGRDDRQCGSLAQAFQLRIVHTQRPQELGNHGQKIGVERHFLERGLQASLHPARAMHEKVNAAHNRAPEREHAFIGGLGVQHRIDIQRIERGGGDVARGDAGLPFQGFQPLGFLDGAAGAVPEGFDMHGGGDALAGDVTKLLFGVRQSLASDYPAIAQMTKPDTDKDAAVLAHPGAAAFIDDDQKTFFDKYSDFIYLGIMVFSGFGSGAAWLASYSRADDRIRKLRALETLLDIAATARSAETHEQLDRLRCDVDDLVRRTMHQVERNDLDESAMVAFSIALNQAQCAISERRAVLTAQGVVPVPTSSATEVVPLHIAAAE